MCFLGSWDVGRKYNLKDGNVREMFYEWVPYVWSWGYGRRSYGYQCSAESAVDNHRCRNDLSSQSKVRRSCQESELVSCKECDIDCSDKEVSLNLDCSSTTRWKHLLAPLTYKNQHSTDYGYGFFSREERQTAPLFSLHLEFSTAFCSTFP